MTNLATLEIGDMKFTLSDLLFTYENSKTGESKWITVHNKTIYHNAKGRFWSDSLMKSSFQVEHFPIYDYVKLTKFLKEKVDVRLDISVGRGVPELSIPEGVLEVSTENNKPEMKGLTPGYVFTLEPFDVNVNDIHFQTLKHANLALGTFSTFNGVEVKVKYNVRGTYIEIDDEMFTREDSKIQHSGGILDYTLVRDDGLTVKLPDVFTASFIKMTLGFTGEL